MRLYPNPFSPLGLRRKCLPVTREIIIRRHSWLLIPCHTASMMSIWCATWMMVLLCMYQRWWGGSGLKITLKPPATKNLLFLKHLPFHGGLGWNASICQRLSSWTVSCTDQPIYLLFIIRVSPIVYLIGMVMTLRDKADCLHDKWQELCTCRDHPTFLLSILAQFPLFPTWLAWW